MRVPIVQVDAFTDKPFAGNPAAVCVLPESRDERWMQNVAMEMNLSETAFLTRQDGGFQLRWFTPTVEVDLCGHATIASAHVLWEDGHLASKEPARFFTKSGLLSAAHNGALIELDFPARVATPISTPPDLIESLDVNPIFVGKNVLDYLVVVENEEIVRHLKPDIRRLKELNVRGVMVTSQSNSSGYDFVSRFFAPGSGVDEDPVTGSSHCCLGPYWRDRLGKSEMMGYQASGRGGFVGVRVVGDRVFLGGKAVTVMRGELLI